MTIAISPQLSLAEFLNFSETKPASEFIDGHIIQKPMPQGEHSRIQGKLCTAINEVSEANRIACAFPELRCQCGSNVVVPDIAVFNWERIPVTEAGRIANRFEIQPDWTICLQQRYANEILSPAQSQTLVMAKILNC